jgi:serine/threonine protein kinase
VQESGGITGAAMAADVEAATALYAGDFLAGVFVSGASNFEAWTVAQRERLHRLATVTLQALGAWHLAQHDFVAAITAATRLTEVDDLAEAGYRLLMEALVHNGQRAATLQVYERCRRRLEEELGMEPARRTTMLYENILAGKLSAAATPPPAVHGYKLKEELDRGAYGVIHRALQPGVGRDVAVKVIRREYADDPAFIRRFEAEAQTIARLEHPYIVPLYDYWRDPEGAYLVMRYLRGGSLHAALQEGPWDGQRTAAMLEQIAGALAAAHRQGIVHRDIKPGNILLDEAGNAYLADFGIAKVLGSERALTAEDAVRGSLDYVSPEQLRSEPVTAQSDIYSLGAVLYETLTAAKPFGAVDVARLVYNHLHEPLPLVTTTRPDVPPEVDVVLQKATAKQPAARYATVLEMASAFRAAIRGAAPEEDDLAPAKLPTLAEVYNPYKGLLAFQESDADDFFGREALVQ